MNFHPEKNISHDAAKSIIANSVNIRGNVMVYHVGINPTILDDTVDVKKTFYVNAYKVNKGGVAGYLFNQINNKDYQSDFYPERFAVGHKELIREIPVSSLSGQDTLVQTSDSEDFIENLKAKIVEEKYRTLYVNFEARSIVNSMIGKVYDLPFTAQEYVEMAKIDKTKDYGTADYLIKKYNKFHDEFGVAPVMVVDQGQKEAARVRSAFNQIDMQSITIKNGIFIGFQEKNEVATITIMNSQDAVLSQLYVPIKSEFRDVNFSDGDSFDITDRIEISYLDFYDKKVKLVESGIDSNPENSLFFNAYASLTNHLYAKQWEDLPSLRLASQDGDDVVDIEDRNSLFLTKKLVENAELLNEVKLAIDNKVQNKDGLKTQKPSANTRDASIKIQ